MHKQFNHMIDLFELEKNDIFVYIYSAYYALSQEKFWMNNWFSNQFTIDLNLFREKLMNKLAKAKQLWVREQILIKTNLPFLILQFHRLIKQVQLVFIFTFVWVKLISFSHLKQINHKNFFLLFYMIKNVILIYNFLKFKLVQLKQTRSKYEMTA